MRKEVVAGEGIADSGIRKESRKELGAARKERKERKELRKE